MHIFLAASLVAWLDPNLDGSGVRWPKMFITCGLGDFRAMVIAFISSWIAAFFTIEFIQPSSLKQTIRLRLDMADMEGYQPQTISPPEAAHAPYTPSLSSLWTPRFCWTRSCFEVAHCHVRHGRNMKKSLWVNT